MKLLSIISIILIFPLFALAHSGEVHLTAKPGPLPGESGYRIEQIKEWLSVNIFTVSSKAKQQKKLGLANKRAAELETLFLQGKSDVHLRTVLTRYQKFLRESRDMAEKIINLDGAEIALAEKFEETTRLHEDLWSELLFSQIMNSILYEGLAEARIQNSEIFRFMVTNYQFDESDIAKHQQILARHIDMVQATEQAYGLENKKIDELLAEARKFQAAGLNVEAYNLIDQAKNLIY